MTYHDDFGVCWNTFIHMTLNRQRRHLIWRRRLHGHTDEPHIVLITMFQSVCINHFSTYNDIICCSFGYLSYIYQIHYVCGWVGVLWPSRRQTLLSEHFHFDDLTTVILRLFKCLSFQNIDHCRAPWGCRSSELICMFHKLYFNLHMHIERKC